MKRILKLAIQEANKSNVVRGKIGAIAYTNNHHIVAKAHNSTFLGSERIKTIHAEESLLQKLYNIDATHRFGDNLNILVVRWKEGVKQFGMAKPCTSCQKSLSRTRFNIYYTTQYGNIMMLGLPGKEFS